MIIAMNNTNNGSAKSAASDHTAIVRMSKLAWMDGWMSQ